jgi:biotin carboxyl carrier protein
MDVEIIAPIAGRIIKQIIEIGVEVKEDDEAFVMEAMKMETFIYTPCDGTVKEVRIKLGDEVDEDDILGVIETI